jgi:hypothetical protein
MLYAGSAMLAVAAVGWGSFFGLRGNWPVFALDVCMLALAATPRGWRSGDSCAPPACCWCRV